MNEWEWQLLEDKATVDHIVIDNVEVRAGDRVRLRPRQGGDVLDIALAGQVAHVEGIEQDYEGKNHVCVVLEDDPGRDLGLLRQPGHRFFFDSEEVEPLPPDEATHAKTLKQPRILVAGIGNIFLGDDGFGVEVARRLATRGLPTGARVADFGIRGFDLAYAVQDGYEAVILVDAYPHDQLPGTVSLIEPDLREVAEDEQATVETHGMDPLKVLRLAATMHGSPQKIFLVGCEPASLGGEEGAMGLTEPVEAAVDQAVVLIIDVVNELLQDGTQLSKGSSTKPEEGESRGR
jgi:hydrogenase maturation protease